MRFSCWLGLLLVAGCGSGNGNVGVTAVPSSPSPTIGSTATVHIGTDGANAFTPFMVTINPGDSVLWVWDYGLHTVTSGAPGAVDGRFCSLPPGSTPSPSACDTIDYAASTGAAYEHTFLAVGTFPYFCEVHGAMMSGVVVVH
jgi:plastocyanin